MQTTFEMQIYRVVPNFYREIDSGRRSISRPRPITKKKTIQDEKEKESEIKSARMRERVRVCCEGKFRSPRVPHRLAANSPLRGFFVLFFF